MPAFMLGAQLPLWMNCYNFALSPHTGVSMSMKEEMSWANINMA